MIIAVYEGCGMDGFSGTEWDRDSVSVAECPLHSDWSEDYLRSVVRAYHGNCYVVVPMIRGVMKELSRLRIPYVLCYPESALAREPWIAADGYGKHIVLEPDEEPGDHRAEIEAYAKEKEVAISIELEEELLGNIRRRCEEGGLCVEEEIRQLLLYMTDHPEAIESCIESVGCRSL